ncbi:PAN domain-containing protein [uncultured Nitrospira sp.]|uniref:PAN domain-containing protein n=1 Tax=uncultured Nitrospira sp. TaxID=157176 RepID=UPI0031401512
MIQLQSLMSQRQMAIALSTNLVNSLHGRFQLEEETDRPGDDYARYTEESPDACRTRCAGNENCQAFTFVKPNPGFTPGQCFLKRSEPKPATDHCCISGTRNSSQEKIIRNIGH